jgi:hypothetical protein
MKRSHRPTPKPPGARKIIRPEPDTQLDMFPTEPEAKDSGAQPAVAKSPRETLGAIPLADAEAVKNRAKNRRFNPAPTALFSTLLMPST